MLGEFGALMKLLGNKDKLQAEVARMAETTANIVGIGEAGGYVKVRVNGRMEVLSCEISEQAPVNDRLLLEGLIVTATNVALASARQQVAAESQKMATNLGVPPSILGSMGGLPGYG